MWNVTKWSSIKRFVKFSIKNYCQNPPPLLTNVINIWNRKVKPSKRPFLKQKIHLLPRVKTISAKWVYFSCERCTNLFHQLERALSRKTVIQMDRKQEENAVWKWRLTCGERNGKSRQYSRERMPGAVLQMRS